jgi:hypothetical protein
MHVYIYIVHIDTYVYIYIIGYVNPPKKFPAIAAAAELKKENHSLIFASAAADNK